MPGRRSGLKREIDGKKCIFCGGVKEATTVDHFPPRSFFVNKIRPKGFEFPACEACNIASSSLDQVAAMMVNIGSDSIGIQDNSEYTKKLMRGVANNARAVLDLLETNGIVSEVEVDVGGQKQRVVRVPVDPRLFNDWLNPWAAKLGAALWNKHTGKIVSSSDRIVVHWIPIEDLWREGIPDEIREALSQEARARQGKIDFGDQFFYRYAVSGSLDYGMFYVVMHSTSAVAISILPARFFSLISKDKRYGSVFFPRNGIGLAKAIIAPLADLNRES